MKIKNIFKGLLATLLLLVFFTGCESYNDALLTDIGNKRLFSPILEKPQIRNQTNVELNWETRTEDDHYVIEFSADDPEFTTIFKTVEVTADELPVLVSLEGETLYSIRVKAVSAGKEDSKWSVTTANTLSEQSFLPFQDGDIQAKSVTLRWTPGINVTNIVLTPGDVTHVITNEEKAAGVATVGGLTPEANYQANLYNGTKKRGAATFTTAYDLAAGAILLNTSDDIKAIIEAGGYTEYVFEPGDYTSQGVNITLPAGAVTFRGLRSYDKPKLNVTFVIQAGSSNVSLIDLDLSGKANTAAVKTQVVEYAASSTYGKLLISGCTIQDYGKSLVGAITDVNAKIESITVENSIVTNVCVSGATGDFIDFRTSYVGLIALKSSTFNNCATGRAFIREDAYTGFGSTLTSNVLIDSCTLYGVTNTISASGYNILYVRFVSNATIIRNSIFAETIARFTNNSATVIPTFSNNNYFNAVTLNTGPVTASVKADTGGTALNPGFTNAAAGDFTISNQTLIDNKVGDPRWIK
ncbi:DUF5123 domain-containing protein [Flavobacterium fluviatile]|uniref:DUF5123 domain-containing protein n=1 Tax=Flavobacterium fluviatile TaxID=1862387 RepID=UPI0013CF83EB|nr:DUF5123 domain-containing protein [Flavobacterium fluviatile]